MKQHNTLRLVRAMSCMACVATVVLLNGTVVFAETMPERPNIGPGETNWVPQGGRLASLSTDDLNSGLTATDLVDVLLGGATCVSVSNITLNGVNTAAGTFAGGTGIIGFESGIILSTGNIASVVGPINTSDSTTTHNGHPGDTDLDTLVPGYQTFDATVLEFDFECPELDVVQFQYVFTSEEYNEFVYSPYNNVFGFFLNGTNIALIPTTTTPVAINNVNCGNPYNPAGGTNCSLFINNDCSDIPPGTFPCNGPVQTEMDGLTQVFTAVGVLDPGVNHIKLAIADAGDSILDSNVFIKAGIFTCVVPSTSEWGLLVMALLLLTGIAVKFGRQGKVVTGS